MTDAGGAIVVVVLLALVSFVARQRGSVLGTAGLWVAGGLAMLMACSVAPGAVIGAGLAVAYFAARKLPVAGTLMHRHGALRVCCAAAAGEGVWLALIAVQQVASGHLSQLAVAALAACVALVAGVVFFRLPMPAARAAAPQEHDQKPSADPGPSHQYAARAARSDFSDLHGQDALKSQLVDAGAQWQKGKNGILLFGPPGTGKTAFAEALAGELGLRLISVTFGDMASKWINETTERLVAMFDAALQQAPVMLFIDEIDAVLTDRASGSGNYAEYERIVATFLGRATQLQGSKVLMVAATNFIDRLDDAAIREGRFDFKIEVPLPDAPARRYLIETRLAAHDRGADALVLDRLTRRWSGFNVPRILAAASAACEIATDEGCAELTYDHFYRGLRKVQGRKGGPPEGAKALDELFLDHGTANRLSEIANQLSRVDEIERLGGSIPKGVLFFGPPGTGKTATAMAVARECGWSFIERNGRDLMQAGAMDKLRTEASDLRPAIVFLDEADDILANRAYSNVKAATNELLTLMDGAGGALEDVVWIAATNSPDAIDEAALRGGRFEQKIMFGPLDAETAGRLIAHWAHVHADTLAGDRAAWVDQVTARMVGQTPANVLSVLRIADNMAVAARMGGGSRNVAPSHVEAAAAEVGV